MPWVSAKANGILLPAVQRVKKFLRVRFIKGAKAAHSKVQYAVYNKSTGRRNGFGRDSTDARPHAAQVLNVNAMHFIPVRTSR